MYISHFNAKAFPTSTEIWRPLTFILAYFASLNMNFIFHYMFNSTENKTYSEKRILTMNRTFDLMNTQIQKIKYNVKFNEITEWLKLVVCHWNLHSFSCLLFSVATTSAYNICSIFFISIIFGFYMTLGFSKNFT